MITYVLCKCRMTFYIYIYIIPLSSPSSYICSNTQLIHLLLFREKFCCCFFSPEAQNNI